MHYWQSCNGSCKAICPYPWLKSKVLNIIDPATRFNSESRWFIGHGVGIVNVFTGLKSTVNRNFFVSSFGTIHVAGHHVVFGFLCELPFLTNVCTIFFKTSLCSGEFSLIFTIVRTAFGCRWVFIDGSHDGSPGPRDTCQISWQFVINLSNLLTLGFERPSSLAFFSCALSASLTTNESSLAGGSSNNFISTTVHHTSRHGPRILLSYFLDSAQLSVWFGIICRHLYTMLLLSSSSCLGSCFSQLPKFQLHRN